MGDYCRFGTQEGTVEDIGIPLHPSAHHRSHSGDDLMVTSHRWALKMSPQRDMFSFSQVFYISFDSEIDKLKEFMEQTKFISPIIPDTNSVWNQVRISGTQQDAYLVEMRCYLNVKARWF